MSATFDIFRSYRHPRRVIRQRLEQGVREDRALVYLVLACGLMFLAQWPQLVRAAHVYPGIPLNARLGGALFGWLFIIPLAAYGVAALSHIVANIFGGQGDWYGARLALFWALLATSPLGLVQGLVAGFAGPGPLLHVVGIVTLSTFLLIWGNGLIEAEKSTG